MATGTNIPSGSVRWSHHTDFVALYLMDSNFGYPPGNSTLTLSRQTRGALIGRARWMRGRIVTGSLEGSQHRMEQASMRKVLLSLAVLALAVPAFAGKYNKAV